MHHEILLDLNLEFFIARKTSGARQKNFSTLIVRIAIIAIALSMAVMIIATASVEGFKTTISEKIFGFWGHIHISSSHSPSNYAFDAHPLSMDQPYYPSLDTIQQVPYTKKIRSLGDFWDHHWSNYLLWMNLLSLVLAFWYVIGLFWKKWRLKWLLFLIVWQSLCSFLNERQNFRALKHISQTEAGIRHIQAFANKEGIIKTKEEIEGIILRGITNDYDWKFLNQYMLEGDTLDTYSSSPASNILISETTANRLNQKLGDKFTIYFVQNGITLARKFTVTGIYKTGLEEYDRRFALVDIRKIQQLNNWRPYKSYGEIGDFGVELWLNDERVNLLGVTAATADNWDDIQSRIIAGTTFNLNDTTSNSVILSDRIARKRDLSVGDTLRLNFFDWGIDHYHFRFKVEGIFKAPNDPGWQKTAIVHWNRIHELNEKLPPQVSGFEAFVENIDDLDPLGRHVNYTILKGENQYASTIKEVEPNIFDWLTLTDMNERIILLLMILVSIINMTTSLMILILERTNMIGILKALGATDWSIRKIFLYNAAYIIVLGAFWGNILGVGLCVLQQQFGIITLPEDLYYVSVAPVQLNFLTILLLNIGTLLITVFVLIIPSWLVTRIDPVRAIRFK